MQSRARRHRARGLLRADQRKIDEVAARRKVLFTSTPQHYAACAAITPSLSHRVGELVQRRPSEGVMLLRPVDRDPHVACHARFQNDFPTVHQPAVSVLAAE